MKKVILLILLVILMLVLSFPAFPEKLTALPELNRPVSIEISGDELYVLDDTVVYVYSFGDFRLLRSFGKQGEGPGELLPNDEIPLAMNIVNDSVFLNSQWKIIQLSKKGKLIKEQKIPMSLQVFPFGVNYVSIKVVNKENGIQNFSVILFDPGFKAIKTLYSRERPNSFRRGKLHLPPEFLVMRSSGDKLFVFDQTGDRIDTFDLKGNQLESINLGYQKLKVTDAFKKRAMEWLQMQPAFKGAPLEIKQMIGFPDYLPVMRNFIVKDKKLYIQTYKTVGDLWEFIILPLDGKKVNKVLLPGFENFPVQFNFITTFTVRNNKFYYLVENIEAEEWELHVKEIPGKKEKS